MRIRIYFVLYVLIFIGSVNAQDFDTLSTESLSPGCRYYMISDTSMPVMIHLVETDLSDPHIDVTVEVANDSLNLGGEIISHLARRTIAKGINVLAAVNADFFGDSPFQAQNSMVRNGEIIKAVNLDRSLIAFDANNKPDIGLFKFNGQLVVGEDTLTVSSINSQDSTMDISLFTKYWRGNIPMYAGKTYYELSYDGLLEPNKRESMSIVEVISLDSIISPRNNQVILRVDSLFVDYFNEQNELLFLPEFIGAPETIKTMTGGLPGLFKGGNLPDSYYGKEGMTKQKFIDKNPRTAIGYDESLSKLYTAVVDGRRDGYSIGLSLMELANFMRNIGCYEALNFDGGGSSTMTVRDSLVNKPSDATGERKVYNSFMIFSND